MLKKLFISSFVFVFIGIGGFSIFAAKASACNYSLYYNSNNQHMRPITKHHRYRSDWDPNTRLMYIVREYTVYEYLSIPAFSGEFKVEILDHRSGPKKVVKYNSSITYCE